MELNWNFLGGGGGEEGSAKQKTYHEGSIDFSGTTTNCYQ